ncbi:flagellin [Pseudarthrobacter sp. L19]|uniref:flagellin N-terminal helical domain-containing protein n=1 Tax=Pseudarthrobacter sp. L19 TaxID=3423951 RepID=UPI003D79A366
MGMQINTNLAANNAYRNLSNTQNDLSKSLEKLSSGLRINRAGDDAAGLALSEGLKSQIGGLTVAARNAQDGIGAVQTAEGGLSQAQSILQRLRDLSVQGANDTNNADSRNAIKTEADSLVSELGRIGSSTNFNGAQLLDGSRAKTATTDTSLKFQVGANGDAASQISVDLGSADVSKIAATLKGQDKTGAALSGSNNLSGVKVDLTAGDTYTVTQANTNASFSFTLAAGDTEAAALAKMQAAAGSDYTVSGDNTAGYKFVSNAAAATGNTISVTAATPANVTAAGTTGTEAAPKGLDFSSASASQASIELLTGQITSVSSARASLGASQNRLESAVQTINVAKENLTASNSRIRDTDMAEEMVKFTRNNILSQAGTAMLAQANQTGQGVLQLLR